MRPADEVEAAEVHQGEIAAVVHVDVGVQVVGPDTEVDARLVEHADGPRAEDHREEHAYETQQQAHQIASLREASLVDGRTAQASSLALRPAGLLAAGLALCGTACSLIAHIMAAS